MKTIFDFENDLDITWCPGCGNYSILKALKSAFVELNLSREKLVIVSGIGQAAKLPQYVNANFFNGLHGRYLPAAVSIKAANPELTIVAVSGDGCTYGEGGNHFLSTIRRNPDITNIVHNNMIYGLTKGQASPTSPRGFTTPVQVTGVCLEPFNPLAVAISLGASFVARAYAGDIDRTKEIIKLAIKNKGYSLVDIFQPCVSFNKINTYQWFKEHTYYLDETYDPHNREKAMNLAFETEKYPLGLIYLNEANKTFEENLVAYKNDKRPLFQRLVNRENLKALLTS